MKRSVKIVAVSDLHGSPLRPLIVNDAIYKKADILVIAGDLQGGGSIDEMRWRYENEFLPAVNQLHAAGIETVLIPGNHDFWLQRMNCNTKWKRPGLHFLVDREDTVCGLRFYGIPWCPFINGRWVYEVGYSKQMRSLFRIPEGIDVLVSHSPPLGIDGENFDVSTQNRKKYWKHFGSKELREEILEKKPRLVLCGHIHTGNHSKFKVGDSIVANVSLLDEVYMRAFGPATISISDKTIKLTKGRNLYA